MRYSGAGLGLSIVAGIVSAHQAPSPWRTFDGGCRFSLLLPGQEQRPGAGSAVTALLPESLLPGEHQPRQQQPQGTHNRIRATR